MFKITDEGEIIGELLDFFIYMNDKFWILWGDKDFRLALFLLTL